MSLYDAGVAALLPSTKAPEAGARRPAAAVDVDAQLFELAARSAGSIDRHDVDESLSRFSAHGGKLIFYHMSDPTFAAMDTLDYYKGMTDANGGADNVQQWSKFHFVPGMLHCRGGEAALDQSICSTRSPIGSRKAPRPKASSQPAPHCPAAAGRTARIPSTRSTRARQSGGRQ